MYPSATGLQVRWSLRRCPVTAAVTPRVDATIWTQLAAPVQADRIQWRIDSAPKAGRDGRFFARFVDAQLVRERLDAGVRTGL